VNLDTIIFNPISSTILKWVRFKIVRWGRDFQHRTGIVWDCWFIIWIV
jgi:hypothetical protein